MIKLASSTLDRPAWSFDEVMERYREYGIAGVEIRGIDGEMEALKMERFFPENVEKTLAAMKAHGLSLVVFGISACLHAVENREELVKYISDTAEVSAYPQSASSVMSFPKRTVLHASLQLRGSSVTSVRFVRLLRKRES